MKRERAWFGGVWCFVVIRRGDRFFPGKKIFPVKNTQIIFPGEHIKSLENSNNVTIHSADDSIVVLGAQENVDKTMTLIDDIIKVAI